ncbi:MAG: FHA domain-containing protein, partial [Planctomycetota bacterium]
MPEQERADPRPRGCYLACFPARPIRLSRDRPTTIGRAEGNTVILADIEVSRRHATIEWLDDAFLLRDAGSRNGVLVNGVKLNADEGRALDPDD